MVGICGAFGRQASSFETSKICNQLQYTGNEQTAIYEKSELTVGITQHSRFQETQPIKLDEQTKLWVWGRIFGYFDGCEHVNRHDVVNDGSESSVIKQAYKRHGNDFINYVNGDFCGVLFNQQNDSIQLVTNRLGSRPIFYTVLDETIYFSTSIQPLVREFSETLSIAEDYLSEYLLLRRVFGENTPINHVYKVAPGSIMDYSPTTGVHTSTYWRPAYQYSNSDKEELVNQFLETLEEIVETLSKSYDNIGLLLSGGSDSRLFAALLNEPELYHMTYWKGSKETQIAEKIAQHLDNELNILQTDEGYYEQALQENPKIMDFISMFTQGHASLFHEQFSEADIMLSAQFTDTFFKGYTYTKKKLSVPNFYDLPLPFHRKITDIDEFVEILLEGSTGADTYIQKDIRQVLQRNIVPDDDQISHHGIKYPNMDNLMKTRYFYPLTNQRDHFAYSSMVQRTPYINPLLDYRLIDLHLRIPPKYSLRNNLVYQTIERIDDELASIPHPETHVGLSSSWPVQFSGFLLSWAHRKYLKSDPDKSHVGWTHNREGFLRESDAVRQLFEESEAIQQLDIIDEEAFRNCYQSHRAGENNTTPLQVMATLLSMNVDWSALQS